MINVSFIFEGTIHVCEVMVVVLRYVTGKWVIKMIWESHHLKFLQNDVTELP